MSLGAVQVPHATPLRFRDKECSEVSEELARILASAWFRSSSRSSLLLRHVVEFTVHGEVDRLRERQIAVEVFHRKPTYDNNSDPIVRVVAGEIRKRLAQYYNDPENRGRLQIALPIGSYIPTFVFPTGNDQLQISDATPALPAVSDPAPKEIPLAPIAPQITTKADKTFGLTSVGKRVVLLLAVVSIMVVTWMHHNWTASQSAYDLFWAPIASSGVPALISVGEMRAPELTFQPNAQRNPRPDTSRIDVIRTNEGIAVQRLGYLNAVAKVAAVLGSKNKPFQVASQSTTTFDNFARQPMIFLGTYDNDWSFGLVNSAEARFQLHMDVPNKQAWISDQEGPADRLGFVNIGTAEPAIYETFSLVLREKGKLSRQPRVVLSGVGEMAIVAAADFVSTPAYLEELSKRLPPEWEQKNCEILLQTRVVENTIGVPTIVAYKVW